LSGFFGPVAPLSPPVVKEDDYENARKRQVDQRQYQAQNGSPTKRPRLSNGYENGFESLPMDVDEPPNGNGHAYPSPKEVEQPPTPIVTNGPEQGTQVDKVTELSSETTFLTLSDNPMSDKPVLLHCAWNPRDPSILAAAGSDALARLWNISRVATMSDAADHVNGIIPPYLDLTDNNTASNSTVGALCWTSDGTAVALASDSADEDSARITIWGVDGSLLQSYGGFEPPITFLQWNPSNKLLLALMPEDEGTAITIFEPSTQAIVAHPLPPYRSVEHSFDATWINDQDFVICGGDVLSTFRWDGKISLTNKFETREDHGLVNVTYDKYSRLLATSSEAGIIDVSLAN
jgi:transducin (beta)-like 1